MDSTRYIITRKDICDMQYLLACVGCPGRVPHRPPATDDVTGPDVNLDFLEVQVGCEALEAVIWLWTAA